MKVLILKPWTPTDAVVGKWCDLSEVTAKHGIAIGVCVDGKGAIRMARKKAADAKKVAEKEVAEANAALEAAKEAEKVADAEVAAIEKKTGGEKDT